MTHSEKILTLLATSKRALTAHDLAAATGFKERSLATVLSTMKRDKLIEPVGGKRGSYQYGLTPKGRAAAAELSSLLARLKTKERDIKEMKETGFLEVEKALTSADELQLLRQFARWLVRNRPELLAGAEQDRSEEQLVEAALAFLSIDPRQLEEQRSRLDKLLSGLR